MEKTIGFIYLKRKVVYTGKCNMVRKTNTNKAELSSRAYIFPDDIAALLDYDKLFDGRHAFMETWPAYWIIHIFEKSDEGFIPYSKLKVDRINNKVTELTIFRPDSFVRVQAFFSDYVETNGQKVPKTVQINWPETSSALSLYLSNLSINETLKPEIFQFKKPRRAEMININ